MLRSLQNEKSSGATMFSHLSEEEQELYSHGLLRSSHAHTSKR